MGDANKQWQRLLNFKIAFYSAVAKVRDSIPVPVLIFVLFCIYNLVLKMLFNGANAKLIKR